MKQKIMITMDFPDLSRDIKIEGVYQKGNTLIAVSRMIATGNFGEAICTRDDSMIVDTQADHVLKVKHYIINTESNNTRNFNISEVKSLKQIHEITGLQPLPVVIEKNNEATFRSSNYSRMFVNKKEVEDNMDPVKGLRL